MKKYFLLLPLTFLFINCSSTKVELRKVNLADTNITSDEYTFKDFVTSFRMFHPEESYNLAETETQKLAAKALEYVAQNRYENAAETFVKAMTEKDSLELLWCYFPRWYYTHITHNWEKLEEYENIRNGITDSSFIFYKDKPKFDIEFVEDSVVIPIKFKNGVPFIKIKINGKYYYFIIDTGLDKTLLGKNIATKNNVVYDSKEDTIKGIDGTATTFSGVLSKLDLGQIKISNFPIYVINRNDAIKAKFLFITFFQSDGIIGWDLLQNFDFTIDYKNKQLILRKPIEKNIERRNLFWYKVPIVKFYSENNYPLLFFFDSGSSLSYFNPQIISLILGIDTNKLKKSSQRLHGVNEFVKMRFYKYPDFQCYTIAADGINYLSANKILLQDIWSENSSINLDGKLGSDWFKDKAIRFDMLNGIFEILE